MSDPTQGKDGDSSYGDDDRKKHDGYEPGGSICCLWRGLGDAKGVYEDIREIEERLHGFEKGCIFSAGGASIAKVRLLRMDSVLAAVVAEDYTK